MRIAITALCVGLFAVAQARADFILDTQGVTDPTSSLNSVPIAAGTSFDIQATFGGVPNPYGPGIAIYSVTSVQLTLGSDSYSVTDPGDISVWLGDSTNPVFPSDFFPYLFQGGIGLLPVYTGTTTAGWSAYAPTPTEFTGYVGALYNEIDMSTTSGTLDLVLDNSHGVIASISAVPLPSSLASIPVGLALVAGIEAVRRRRATCG